MELLELDFSHGDETYYVEAEAWVEFEDDHIYLDILHIKNSQELDVTLCDYGSERLDEELRELYRNIKEF